MKGKPSVLVFGLDGACWRVLEPLLETGKLPALAGLIKKGVHGALHSTYPPVTGPAWVSLATGKRPESHGVFDFTRERPGEEPEPFTADQVDGAAVWEVLGKRGWRVGVVNVPGTWPARPDLNGFAITGLLSPKDGRIFFPSTLGQELEEAGLAYKMEADPQPERRNHAYLEGLLETLETRKRATLYLLKKHDPDFFMVVVRETDAAQHRFWKYCDPGHPRHPGKNELEDAIARVYVEADRHLAALLEQKRFDDVVVLSDHGFGPLTGQILLNNALARAGWLVFKKHAAGAAPAGAWVRRAMHLPLVRGFVHALFSPAQRHALARKIVGNPFARVDWEKTRAFAAGNGGQVYLNLPPGTPPEKARAERARLKAFLESLRHPATRAPLFKKVHEKEDLYRPSARHFGKAPDLYVVPADESLKVFPLPDDTGPLVDDRFTNSGDHRFEGVLVLAGAGVKKGARVEGARIEDVAPTLLYALGQPALKEMDGRALLEAFQDPSPAPEPESEAPYLRTGARASLSAQEKAAIARQLKGLGYA